MQRFMKSFAVVCVSAMMCVLAMTPASMADDWIVTKLRGNVFAYDDGHWERLDKGSVVSDDRAIRTTRGGRAEFQRDAETINVGGDTQIRISDRDGQRYTIVKQDFGQVTIEAEKLQVKHFAVHTPFLAAVVKGTQFVVSVTQQDAKVEVTRGVVSTIDTLNDLMVDVLPGQMAVAGLNSVLAISGKGQLAAITDLKGNAVSESTLDAIQNGGNSNGNGGGNGNGNGKGNGGASGLNVGVGVGVGVGGGRGVNVSVGGGGGVGASVGGGAGGLGVDVNVGGLGLHP